MPKSIRGKGDFVVGLFFYVDRCLMDRLDDIEKTYQLENSIV
jgi:hypothetical protein